MNRTVQLFSNPGSGRHTARKIAALIRAFESLGATVVHSESAQGVPQIRDDADHVCIAAGDGTVRHVAGAVARSGRPVPLSIYPAGTVNLLAMEAGYPRNPRRFARMVLESEGSRPHYPVTIGDGYFFACAGVGPDAFAVARVSSSLKRQIGRLAYAAATLGLLRDWPRQTIRLTCDGGETQCEAFYVAKGRYYAGRWSFAREARVHEPTLRVVALRQARRRDYARFLWAVLTGGDVAALANVAVFQCKTLTAVSDTPLEIQADGDIVGNLPATMTVAEAPLVFC